ERVVRSWVGWIELDCLAQSRLCTVEVSLLFQSCAQHEVSLAIIRLERNGSLHLFRRSLKFSALPVSDSQSIVRLCHPRVELESPVELCLCISQLVPLFQGNPEIIMRDC